MIPKVIHYCWFGGNPLPKLAKKCLKSWKKYCPDYEIIEWNESNYDIATAPEYVKQAYEAKKWAFVTDYVRLQVVYENGGIYLDTDVEIIKPLDNLLKYSAYYGYELNYVATGLGFGAEKGNITVKAMMQEYLKLLPTENGQFEFIACPILNTKALQSFGLIVNGETIDLGVAIVFSAEYFCPKSQLTNKISIVKNTYSIHHFTASWFSPEEKKKRGKNYRKNRKWLFKIKIINFVKRIIGEEKYQKIKMKINKKT